MGRNEYISLKRQVRKNKPFIETGAFAGYEMYENEGSCLAGGTVAGVGYVSGRRCVILANNQKVKAGDWFPITRKKNLRLQEKSIPILFIFINTFNCIQKIYL